MYKTVLRGCLLAAVAATYTLPASAQNAPAPQGDNALPRMLVIYREEVRPGKTAAHATNEAAWAAAFTKGQAPVTWLAMTSLAGPTEAWFMSAYESWAAIQAEEDAMTASAALTADQDKFSAQDGELLSRTSRIVVSFRPALSYQPEVKLPSMRYVAVDVVRVKPGRIGAFAESWRSIVEAHKTAKMDEHWSVYQVVAGQPDGTYFFMYPMKSLEELDKSGPMHGADAYRDAVGESGRAKANEMTISSVDSSQRLVFALSPRMSLLPKEWSEADSFWAPKAPPTTAAAPAKKSKAN